MAAHSSQGPQLGLPQMIQSRPQFGYIGALLVWLFAYIQYAGFNIFNTILAGEAVAAAGSTGSSNRSGIFAVTVIAVLIALVGLRPHPLVRALPDLRDDRDARPAHRRDVHPPVPAARLLRPGHFNVLAVPGPARRRRRLPDLAGPSTCRTTRATCPPTSPTRRTFQWTFWGSALGGIWVMLLGSCIAAGRGQELRHHHRPIKPAAELLFPGFGGDRPDDRRPGAGLGHRAEHVRRLADADLVGRQPAAGPADRDAADLHHRGHGADLAGGAPPRRRELPRRTSTTSCCWCCTSSSRGRPST